MRVCLLGPVEVTDGSRRVTLGGVKERVVLAVLALNANRVLSDWTLIDALWGDATPPSGVVALRSHLHRLRRRLEQAHPHGDRLETRPGGYLLRLASDELDVSLAERLLVEGREALARGAGAAAAERLTEADALWRGRPLDDLADHVAVRDDAIRLGELRYTILEALAGAELALGHHAVLVARLEAAVLNAPLRERLWEQLILALYRCRRQSEALAAYQRCRRLLRDELGIDPNAELVALDEAVLLQKPELDWDPAQTHAPPPTARPSDTAGRQAAGPAVLSPVSQAPFVGRRDEMRGARQWWRSVQAGAPRILLIEGEAGQGKTRLAAEFAAEVTQTGGVVLAARCDPDVVVSYRPLAEALAPLLDVYSTVSDDAAPGPRDPAREVAAVTDAVLDALRRSEREVVVVLDDLHWADRGTAGVVRQLARSARPGRFGVVVTARNPEAHLTADGARVLRELHHEASCEVLSLGAISPEAVGELIAAREGQPVSDAVTELATSVHVRSGGNALFVSELVRHIHDLAITQVPESVVSLVAMRLARLPYDAKALLNVASIVGQVFDVAVVESAVSRALPVEAYEMAVRASLIVEASDVVGRFEFCHAVIRDAVEAQLSAMRRADLHRRIAQAIEVTFPARIEEIAHHHAAAATPGRATDAIEWALRASQAAIADARFQDAAEHATRGSRLAAETPTSLTLQCDLELAGLESAYFADDYDAIDQHRQNALTLAERAGSPVRFAHAASHIRFQVGDDPAGPLGLLERALDALGRDSDELRATLLSTRADVLLMAGTSTDLLDVTSEEAVALARRAGDARGLLWALATRTEVLSYSGRSRECRRLCDERVALGSSIGRWWAVHARVDRAQIARLQAADRTGFEDDLQFLRHHSFTAEAHAHTTRLQGMLAILDGRFDEAKRLAAQAVEHFQQSSNVNASYFVQRSAIAWERGELDKVMHALEAVRDLAKPIGIDVWVAGTLAELGRVDEARVVLDQLAIDEFGGVPRGFYWPFWSALLATAIARVGSTEHAMTLRPLLQPYAGQILVAFTGIYAVGAADRYLAMLDMTSHDYTSATRSFATAVELEQQIGSEPLLARTRTWWAKCLMQRRSGDDLDNARRLLEQASTTARQLDMQALGAETQHLIATLSTRS